ncbi:MAG: glycosyltransferase family 4 protein [Fimbriimonadaceae bacterium]|nr:glycosyltransferase family 4 protein [Fimbriimonadaceae bacterium]
MPERPKLGYVMAVLEARSGEHAAHIPRLLGEIGKGLDIDVIVWNQKDEVTLPGVQAMQIVPRGSLFRKLRHLRRLIVEQRRAGYHLWFIRGAGSVVLLFNLVGARTVFWICGRTRPPSNWRDRVGQWLFKLALRTSRWIATAPGMDAYNTAALGVPASKQLLLNNDIDLTVYQPASPEQIAATRAELGLDPSQRVVLFVHRLIYERGADALIPLLDALAAAGQAACLVAIGGPGEQSAALEAYAAAHPERLRLLGHRPNDELPRYYGAADVFIMPSRVDGFPRVMLEAMACRVPVVSTPCEAVPPVLPADLHPELLVDFGDHAGLAARVLALLRDEPRRVAIGERLLARAGDYTVQRVAEQYIATFSRTDL